MTLTKLRHSCLQGMEYLHQKRIVHFDLKSANLLLGYRDRRAVCKVADFGLSKQKRDTYVSNVTSQRGTLPWIAPEIIKTPHAVTEKVSLKSPSNPMLCQKVVSQWHRPLKCVHPRSSALPGDAGLYIHP